MLGRVLWRLSQDLFCFCLSQNFLTISLVRFQQSHPTIIHDRMHSQEVTVTNHCNVFSFFHVDDKFFPLIGLSPYITSSSFLLVSASAARSSNWFSTCKCQLSSANKLLLVVQGDC